jgi:hypothetical protein
MKSQYFMFPVIVTLVIISATVSSAEESLFVQPFRAKVFAKPSIAAEVLGSVDSGFQFDSPGKEGIWVKLIFKGKPGYIPAVQTAKTPPLGKSAAQNVEPGAKLGARARTSSTSAVVAGMKGLTYEDRARISKGEQSDFESLEKVDAVKIYPEEITQFQLEGGKR